MEIDPWQVPVLVMAGLIVLRFVAGAAPRRWFDSVAKTRVRTVALGLLTGLVLMMGMIAALGPSLADQLASVAGSFAGIVALWLTYRSYRAAGPDPRAGSTAEEERHDQPVS